KIYTLYLHDALPIFENGTASTSEMTDVTEDIEGKDSNIADLVGSRGIEDDEEIVSPEDIFTQVEVSINEKFQGTTFLFPSTVMEDRKSTRLNSSHVS